LQQFTVGFLQTLIFLEALIRFPDLCYLLRFIAVFTNSNGVNKSKLECLLFLFYQTSINSNTASFA
jgi:hypothetical protein